MMRKNNYLTGQEGSQASGTSKKTELKLVNVARASLEELLLDYSPCEIPLPADQRSWISRGRDYLRQHHLPLWGKSDERALAVRALCRDRSHTTYETYRTYLEQPESAANLLVCLIHQTNYLFTPLERVV